MEIQAVIGNTIANPVIANWQVVLDVLKMTLVSDSAYIIVTRVPTPAINNFEQREQVGS